MGVWDFFGVLGVGVGCYLVFECLVGVWVGDVVLFQQGFQQFWVGVVVVVVFVVVFDYQFLVGGFVDGGLYCYFGVFYVVWFYVVFECCQEVVDGWWVFCQVDEDVVVGGFYLDWFQVVFFYVEVGVYFGVGEQQVVIQFVGLLVVGVDQFGYFVFFVYVQV